MPRPTTGRATVACLLMWALLSASTPTHAQWTWRDQTGRINASDRPPPREIPDKDILGRPPPPQPRVGTAPAAAAPSAATAAPGTATAAPSSASAPPTALEREVEARKRAAEQEQKAKAKADEDRLAAQRSENCRRARSQLAALDSGQRMARMNDKGEREVLDDRARAEEQRQARGVIGSDCR